ncbi:GntR family transcriptional regulator [Streptomyces harbinensis]|uniref:GntR family transcriptional regulator n=1 Tax=Streptomyces harbinensis TaxID=1176198 RepID=UPI0036C07247
MPEKWTSVSAPYVLPRADGETDAWTAAAPGRTSQRLLEVGERIPPEAVREAIGATGAAVVRRRLILLDGQPVELADSYYPRAIAAGTPLAEPGRIKGGAPTALARLGHHPARATEDIETHGATEEEAALLDVAPGSPVMTLLRTTYSTTSDPIEVSLMTMRPPRRLRYELEITDDR